MKLRKIFHESSPVEIDIPVVLSGQSPHILEHVALRIVTLVRGRTGGFVGALALRQARQALGER